MALLFGWDIAPVGEPRRAFFNGCRWLRSMVTGPAGLEWGAARSVRKLTTCVQCMYYIGINCLLVCAD